MAEEVHRNALPAGYCLLWYELEAVLGQGSFGITYLARDTNLDQRVAIKEYLPIEVAMREGDCSVHPVATGLEAHYRQGLDDFLREARTLAQFDHPNIVRVHSVFEANNTAYMVMRYESGKSLSQILSHRGKLGEAELLAIVLPVLDGLELVHATGFIHRDIKPPNLFIRDDGSPVLLDFGSARKALDKATRTLTTLVSPGYAPFEQYHSRGERQGPWTDVYALGATMYRALLGVPPKDAMDRSERLLGEGRDSLVSAQSIGNGEFDARVLVAIDAALSFQPERRPQSVGAWAAMLPSDDISLQAKVMPTADICGAGATSADKASAETPRSPISQVDRAQQDEPQRTEDCAGTDARQALVPKSATKPEEGTVCIGAADDASRSEVAVIGLMSSFIGAEGRNYYLERFLRWHASGKKPWFSWNAAALLGPFWLLYRKLWLWALIVFPVLALAGTATVAAALSITTLEGGRVPLLPYGLLLLAFTTLLPAIFGNSVYYRFIRDRISKARAEFQSGDEQRAWLERVGGCSRFAPVLLAAAMVLLGAGLFAGGSALSNAGLDAEAAFGPRDRLTAISASAHASVRIPKIRSPGGVLRTSTAKKGVAERPSKPAQARRGA